MGIFGIFTLLLFSSLTDDDDDALFFVLMDIFGSIVYFLIYVRFAIFIVAVPRKFTDFIGWKLIIMA